MKIIRWTLAELGIFGAFLNAMQLSGCFTVWIIANIGWIAVNLYRKEWPETVLFSVYLLTAVTGLIVWNHWI